MRATVMYGAGDVRVKDGPDARLIEPADALARVTRAGRVFDCAGSLDEMPDGSRALNDRESVTFLIEF
jgi:hypothetical protein